MKDVAWATCVVLIVGGAIYLALNDHLFIPFCMLLLASDIASRVQVKKTKEEVFDED